MPETIILRKIHKWEIGYEIHACGLGARCPKHGKWDWFVRNEWSTYSPILYPHNLEVAYDFPERIPKGVKDAARNIMIREEIANAMHITDPFYQWKG
jgi:hypothetical protein